MTQEDKELLLKDLSARLSYGVKVNEDIQGDATLIGLTKERALTTCEVEGKFNDFPIELVKPYLFPLSSMTEEQKSYLYFNTKFELDRFGDLTVQIDEDGNYFYTDASDCTSLIDWLNKNHFDYRGLIPKGLANNATGLNIY